MKILIHGFGAMGKMVLEEAQKNPIIEVVGIIERSHFENAQPNLPTIYTNFNDAPKADIIIDFSHPSLLLPLLEYAQNTKTGLVLATTGYSDDDLKVIEQTAKAIPIFQSYNMSLGLRMVLDALRTLAPQAEGQFDIEIEERHHRKKVDAPSGTAWLLFRTIAAILPNKKAILDRFSKKEARKPEEIGIVALRGGTILGEHTVLFAGADELIEIKHTALSKRIFATGSLSAAKFLLEKSCGLYHLDNIHKN